MSCSNFLILVSSFLVILAAACQDSDEGNEAGVMHKCFQERQVLHEEATGAKGIFFSGKNSRSSGCQEEGERGLALTVKHLPLAP